LEPLIPTSFPPNEMIDIIRHGLRKSRVPKNIVIVGAGLAGLPRDQAAALLRYWAGYAQMCNVF
jgi:hypothetical protein